MRSNRLKRKASSNRRLNTVMLGPWAASVLNAKYLVLAENKSMSPMRQIEKVKSQHLLTGDQTQGLWCEQPVL